MGTAIIVAIDGPAGSGKSTIARMLAAELGLTYLDTGAMYRAVACQALELGVDTADEDAIADVASRDEVSFGRAADGSQTVSIAGRDVTRAIRTPQVDALASGVAQIPRVRELMVARQRALVVAPGAVCEGRDIGTTVFPKAQVKVFLTASPIARARRRVAQNIERGMTGEAVDEKVVLASILERDRNDSTRAVSPLRQAEDAHVIDSSDMTIDEVKATIANLVEQTRSTHEA